MARRWRVSLAGPVCLEDSFDFWLEMEHVPRGDWPEVTLDLQVMEAEVLRLAREQQAG